MLRLFLLFRVLKLFRYTPSLQQLTQVLNEKRFELYTLGLFVGFMVFASSTGIYLIEATDPRSEINTFFDAVYWAVITLSTVGYGDITPQTVEGRFITLILIVTGLAVLSFSTSIIVSAFSERLLVMRERRIHLEAERLSNMVLICGYGRVGEIVAERLRDERQDLLVLDHRQSRVDLAQQRGFLALCADASSNQILEEVGIHQRTHTVVCITDSDVTNVFIALTVRQLNPNIRIVARAIYTDSIAKLYRAGADVVITANDMVGLVAAELVEHPQIGWLLLKVMGERQLGMDALHLTVDSPFAHQTVADLLAQYPALLLFGVVVDDLQRAQQGSSFSLGQTWLCFNPPQHFLLLPKDCLLLIGRTEDLPQAGFLPEGIV
jgi:voltage-gated potassium channel